MHKTVIQIDYSDICKDYNTVYLDRDNNDRETTACMQKVLAWTRALLSDIVDRFGYGIYYLNSAEAAEVSDVASKRFLFYSLEKGITVQNFVFQNAPVAYESLTSWEMDDEEGMLVHNDEDGEGIFIHLTEDSELHRWIVKTLEHLLPDETSA